MNLIRLENFPSRQQYAIILCILIVKMLELFILSVLSQVHILYSLLCSNPISIFHVSNIMKKVNADRAITCVLAVRLRLNRCFIGFCNMKSSKQLVSRIGVFLPRRLRLRLSKRPEQLMTSSRIRFY